MRTNAMLLMVGGLTTGLAAGLSAQGNMVQAHVGHVMESFNDTPDKKGLLPTAMEEAKIAAQHAELAAKDTSNLDAMKRHAGHVIHALDPTVETQGPGLGYGVKKAAEGVSRHIGLAAESEGASDGVKNHAGHVKGFADLTAKRASETVAMAQQIQKATTAEAAALHTGHVNEMMKALIEGEDENGDGKVGLDEGGLQQAEVHMGLLRKS